MHLLSSLLWDLSADAGAVSSLVGFGSNVAALATATLLDVLLKLEMDSRDSI